MAPITEVTTLLGLTLLASVSPLLTLARLWQLKEWRWDRLREHLRSFGILRQLFGITRPVLIAAGIALGHVGSMRLHPWTLVTLGALALLTVIQIVLRRQPRPVWTQKALTLTGTAALLTLIAGLLLIQGEATHVLLPLMVLLQPLFLALAWILWKPVDVVLKNRILGAALKLRAAYPNLTVVGITGSVGKTTTKELLAHILKRKNPFVTPEHVNSEMGVAQWVQRTLPEMGKEEERLVIVEMGAYRKGEITFLCSLAKPQIGILTSIGTQHLALFGGAEALVEAKAELIEALPTNGHAFLNGDNEACRTVAKKAKCPVTLVGTGGHLDLEAFEIEETPGGIRFQIAQQPFTVPIHGTHNVTNVLLAVAAAEHLGIPMQESADSLRSFVPIKNTFEVREEQGVTILDDTHNASPASFAAAIEWARSHPAAKKILLTSGIIELGEEEEKVHTKLGADSAPVFQEAIFTGKHSAAAFERGYGRKVKILGKGENIIPPGSLLVCIGFVPQSIIQRILSSQQTSKPANNASSSIF
ncbi:MAG TPA: UDP-N-acetylmuramoyl-tripeptide--D-alanyl-D-alanine ligase [Candidatus Peribacteraceae bacterium]|nr:UDP-N-acetylmuramoyl-tripeptide--D-alanyl-D-alanine ligase [Candidatus Peribacteraceae bacterium]